MLLSIIIPYYKTLELTKELLDILIPQLKDNIEVILVDDGCNETSLEEYPITIVHLPMNSGVAGVPRNVGLEIAKGEYIAFIDSDDKVADNYIEEILNAINFKPDIINLSWRSKVHNVIAPLPEWNCTVWARVFKRSLIGDVRFREDLKKAEDWVFIHDLKPNTSINIKKQIYFYNSGRKGSLTNG